MSPPPPSLCSRCHSPLAEATEGLCARCLMAEAMQPTNPDGTIAQPTLTPEQLTPYFPQLEILECLGRGGMGVVYKARQKSLNRLVALKLLAPERADDPQFATRFEKEAQALAVLSHPNIVAVHDFGHVAVASDTQLYYLLMEFVDGVNLRQLLQTKRLTPKEALSIVPPVCDALQCAHDHGIVHRDIKPENLLIDKNGIVKIADFGIAKIVHSSPLAPREEPCVVTNTDDSRSADIKPSSESPSLISRSEMATMGTPAYAAPEQQNGNADHRADIYSLGVVLYEMLTGERPKGDITPPSKRVQVDIRIDEIVLRALEKTPELRFSTATEFRMQVEALAAPELEASEPERAPTLFFVREGRRRICGPVALKLCGTIGLVALGAKLVIAIGLWRYYVKTWPMSETGQLSWALGLMVASVVLRQIGSKLAISPASAKRRREIEKAAEQKVFINSVRAQLFTGFPKAGQVLGCILAWMLLKLWADWLVLWVNRAHPVTTEAASILGWIAMSALVCGYGLAWWYVVRDGGKPARLGWAGFVVCAVVAGVAVSDLIRFVGSACQFRFAGSVHTRNYDQNALSFVTHLYELLTPVRWLLNTLLVVSVVVIVRRWPSRGTRVRDSLTATAILLLTLLLQWGPLLLLTQASGPPAPRNLSTKFTVTTEDTRLPVMRSVQTKLAAFHQGQPDNRAVVKVVYFHASDREPLPNHAERLQRILKDVSEFYREGLENLGVKSQGIPFERDASGRFVVRLVRGAQPSSHYTYESGQETWNEVQQSLTKDINAERDHVLIIYGLCDTARDGRYIFHAPYYSFSSDHQHGVCHAVDCELLDPRNLTSTKPMAFSEHNYPHKAMTVGEFNSWYLGGIAHELGHALGLPHDNGMPQEDKLGVSLMGMGNLNYREHLHGGKAPAYISLASAIRLAAKPLISRSDKARWEPVQIGAYAVEARALNTYLTLSGRVSASVPVCAVIATIWSAAKDATDHRARTFCSAVDEQGGFDLRVGPPGPVDCHLKLSMVLVNGAEASITTLMRVDAAGKIKDKELTLDLQSGLVELLLASDPERAKPMLTDEAIAQVRDEEARHRLQLLQRMTLPEAEPIDLDTTNDKRVLLSDAQWIKAEVGWGAVSRNRWSAPADYEQGLLLRVGGKAVEKGLYAHASSRFEFATNARWQTFNATAAMRDGAPEFGSAVFIVEGDGVELARSHFLKSGESEPMSVKIDDVKSLVLRAEGTEGNNHGCWSMWCDPAVERRIAKPSP